MKFAIALLVVGFVGVQQSLAGGLPDVDSLGGLGGGLGGLGGGLGGLGGWGGGVKNKGVGTLIDLGSIPIVGPLLQTIICLILELLGLDYSNKKPDLATVQKVQVKLQQNLQCAQEDLDKRKQELEDLKSKCDKDKSEENLKKVKEAEKKVQEAQKKVDNIIIMQDKVNQYIAQCNQNQHGK